jgi:glycosyltransferase involved in cell wall biosynthesis
VARPLEEGIAGILDLMTSGLRVLYLAPPSPDAARLSRYSFLDEEIRAFAARGVHAYVLSRAEGAERDDACLHVRMLPSDSGAERRRTVTFLGRHLPRVPLRNMLDVPQCYRGLRVERFAAELIEREHIDLVHSYFAWPRGFGGQLAAAATDRPLVAGMRGSDVNTVPDLEYGARLDPFFDRAVRRLLATADRTIFVSDFLRRQGVGVGARPERTTVILKGVHLEQFSTAHDKAAARQAVGGGSDPLILAVAGLVRIKGLHHILEALAIVRTEGRRFSFGVCGEGPEREALEEQAKRLGLSDCVKFWGKVPRNHIAIHFAAADILVHGSIIEASGNVLLEAMASGLPIVCTDAGGPGEYVKHGRTGFVGPVADPAAMAEHLVRLLDDSALRHTMGAQGRALALQAYAYDRMIDETLQIYGSVVGTGASADALSTATSARVASL